MAEYTNKDYFWWKQPDKELHNSVFALVKHLDAEQSYVDNDNYRHMRLYGNLEAYALRSYTSLRTEPTSLSQQRVTLNIVQSMTDTVVSKITKNTPKPSFLTEGGDFSMQRRAMKLTQFVEGTFEATDYYQKSAKAFKDSCINGTGAIKFYKQNGEVCAERVFIGELTVNDSEAIYGDPRSLYQKKHIHIDVLKAAFPDFVAKIDALGSPEMSTYQSNTFDRRSNMILVTEAWHRPSGKDAKDGKHVICIENATLFTEEWTKDYFPFVFHRWCECPLGFWGQGLAEQLTGLQLEINKILRTIQISMHLVSIPKIFVEAGSNVVSAHLNNKIGGIIKFVGTKPTMEALGTIPPDLFNHLDRLYSRAYEIAGISQLSANAQKPAGLDSGKALREYNDIESERFMEVGKRYERTFIQASKIIIDLAKELAKDDPDYAIKAKNNQFLQTLKWKDVDMEHDEYIMQVFPTSSLASSPAGRLQDVQELLAAGFINKEDGMKLLDFPDLRQFYNFNNAGVEDIERTIEAIIDSGDYQTPEPYQNLQMGITKMQQAYLLYKSMNAPEEKLEMFRRWIEDAATLLKKAANASAAPTAPSLPPAGPEDSMLVPGDQAQIPPESPGATPPANIQPLNTQIA